MILLFGFLIADCRLPIEFLKSTISLLGGVA